MVLNHRSPTEGLMLQNLEGCGTLGLALVVFNKEIAMFIDSFGVPGSLSLSCCELLNVRFDDTGSELEGFMPRRGSLH